MNVSIWNISVDPRKHSAQKRMATSTTSVGRRGSFRRSGVGGMAATTNAYVSVSVRSLDSSVLVDAWNTTLTKLENISPGSSRWVLGGVVGVSGVALLALWALIDVLAFYSRICDVVVPVAALVCGYLLLALTFRSTWTSTGIYLTFCGGVIGEIIGFFLFSMMTSHDPHQVRIPGKDPCQESLSKIPGWDRCSLEIQWHRSGPC